MLMCHLGQPKWHQREEGFWWGFFLVLRDTQVFLARIGWTFSMSGSIFLIHTLKEITNWWMNLFPCFTGNSFKRKHIQHFHMEFRSGMQRDSSDDGFFCLTSEKLHRVSDWIMTDLCYFAEQRRKTLLFSATYTFPCPHWYHSYKMELIASCCHQMPRNSAKIRGRNGNVTNRLHFKTPLILCSSCIAVAQELSGCCSNPGGENPSQAVVAEGAWIKAVNIPHRSGMCCSLFVFLLLCLVGYFNFQHLLALRFWGNTPPTVSQTELIPPWGLLSETA